MFNLILNSLTGIYLNTEEPPPKFCENQGLPFCRSFKQGFGYISLPESICLSVITIPLHWFAWKPYNNVIMKSG